jgi:DNA processing protein
MKNNLEISEIAPRDHIFLSKLAHIPSPPKIIYTLGQIPTDNIAIAIVGTRKSSSYGNNIARDFARNLALNKFIVISGLALGIDTNAHLGALDGNGKTIAVLANGLDNIYPASNKNLADSIIASGGCLISEYAPETPSYPNQFILRNRIISGLSSAVIVIEAPEKSGALATAEFAIKQGKKVFVVPGQISSGAFAGSHKLIRKGATLIRTLDDFFEDIGHKTLAQRQLKMYDLNCDEQKVFDSLKSSDLPTSVDKICEMTKLSPREVNVAVSSLLFKDAVREESGKYSIR